ncbi:MAG: DUF488 family protein [Rufibacter sp.]
MPAARTIWTIGHSTRSFEELVLVLQSFQIDVLADVRRYPGSKKFPHFQAEFLAEGLPKAGIQYMAMPALGGRRKPKPDSVHTAWRSESFRGYADYADTPAFSNAILELEEKASHERTAYICSEAAWWRCHRAIISDVLKERGWNVQHIMKEGKATEHPFTPVYLEEHG